MGLVEAVGILQRSPGAELGEHLGLDLSLRAELLEDGVGPLLVVRREQLERVEPVGQLVEQEMLGLGDLTLVGRDVGCRRGCVVAGPFLQRVKSLIESGVIELQQIRNRFVRHA